MPTLYENLSDRMIERGLDKRFPSAFSVMQRAATAYNEIRAIRESVLADKNLSSTGQQAEIGKRLEKAAPTLRKHRQAIDRARADIDRRRTGLRPKFERTDPTILIAVAARLAAMKPGEQAGQLLPEGGKDTDPFVAQAVLELPPILSNVSEQFRTMLETRLLEKNHGPALATLDAEQEAWDTADAALRTATDAMQTAGEFPSAHAFNLWFAKVAPPDVPATPDERRETQALTVDQVLAQTRGLSSEAYGKLQKGIAEQSSEQFQRELRAIGTQLGVS
jgi:hypothetical protein